MNKILLIIQREYLSRVKKKSFIVMTFLGPILIAGVYALAIWLAVNSDEMSSKKKITVIDESHTFYGKIKDSKTLEFVFSSEPLDSAKKHFKTSGSESILYISKGKPGSADGVELYSEKQPSISVTSYIENALQNSIEDQKLIDNGIDKEVLANLKTDVNIKTIKITDNGEEKGSSEASFGIGFFAGFLIYMFIFLYGVQVMRGVIEEKNNRIVEVIISSVKPFQLMMGKILGIAMVGLTQFLLWVILTVAISGFVTTKIVGTQSAQFEQMREQAQNKSIGSDTAASEMQKEFKQEGMAKVMSEISTLNFPLILGTFLFYFLAGYLLYSALFAAIGSAVDNESETQQFMFPVTMPLIFGFIMSTSAVINNPDGALAFWLSIIPLTSPIVMMVRIPFGVPGWQLALSMALMILGFLTTVWLASRIYRTGILMYGKKVNFKELGKWLFYKG